VRAAPITYYYTASKAKKQKKCKFTEWENASAATSARVCMTDRLRLLAIRWWKWRLQSLMF
jgi:hypothetical protein